MASIQFEWDEAKNLANQRKHGISFDQAMLAFRDPFYTSLPDRVEDGEQRWQTFGIAEGILLLMVAHTTTEMTEENTSIEVVRIITARPATRKERRRYEDQDG